MPSQAREISQDLFYTLLELMRTDFIKKDKIKQTRLNLHDKTNVAVFCLSKVHNPENSIEGVISGNFKFTFKVFLNQKNVIQYVFSESYNFISEQQKEQVLWRVLRKIKRDLSNPGGRSAKGFYLKATKLSEKKKIDEKYWNLAISSRLFHEQFKKFGIINHVECCFRE